MEQNSLKEITTIEQLVVFLPRLLEIKRNPKSKWEPSLDEKTFTLRLFSALGSHQYWGELDDNGSLKYFATLERARPTAFCWLFYVSPKYPELTKDVVTKLKDFFKSTNGKKVYLTTERLTRSYERWMRKTGFTVESINYSITL